MTTPESEKRARTVLWLLVVLLLAVIGAFLVYRWLDDDNNDGGVGSATNLVAATTTLALSTTTTAAPVALDDPSFGYAARLSGVGYGEWQPVADIGAAGVGSKIVALTSR